MTVEISASNKCHKFPQCHVAYHHMYCTFQPITGFHGVTCAAYCCRSAVARSHEHRPGLVVLTDCADHLYVVATGPIGIPYIHIRCHTNLFLCVCVCVLGPKQANIFMESA
jgi:hypothetical protein